MSTGAGFARGSSRQDYATPWNFVSACEVKFGPTAFDLAASAENAKAKQFFTEAQNSLAQTWHTIPGLLFLNPPFNDIAPWAKKCAVEAEQGAKILFLTPASVGSNWFRDHVFQKAQVQFLNGRISFDGIAPYPKDLILACYGFGFDFKVWRWTDDVLI